MNTTVIVISVIVYILSGILEYFAIRKLHSKDGVYEYINPSVVDFVSIFIPYMNTIFCILNWLSIWAHNCKKESNFLNKFFKIK